MLQRTMDVGQGLMPPPKNARSTFEEKSLLFESPVLVP